MVENVHSGEQQFIRTKILISASGILGKPRMPDIPGIASFKGEAFHCGNWDTNVSLTGKKVGVIGNGASA